MNPLAEQRPLLLKTFLFGSVVAAIVILTAVYPALWLNFCASLEFSSPLLSIAVFYLYLAVLAASAVFSIVLLAWSFVTWRGGPNEESRHMVQRLVKVNGFSVSVLVLIGIGQWAMLPPFVMPVALPTTPYLQCHYNLIQIDSAKEQWAFANNRTNDEYEVVESEVDKYIKRGRPSCPDGGVYIYGRVGEPPRCTIYDLRDKAYRTTRRRVSWVFSVRTPSYPKGHCLVIENPVYTTTFHSSSSSNVTDATTDQPAFSPEFEKSADLLKQKIAEVLPKGWTVEEGKNPITITKEAKVTLAVINGPYPPEEYTLHIWLFLEPKIYPKEYMELRRANDEVLAKMRTLGFQIRGVPYYKGGYKPRTDEEKLLVDEYHGLESSLSKLPEFWFDECSVSCRAMGEDNPCRFTSESAYAECHDVLNRIKKTLQPY